MANTLSGHTPASVHARRLAFVLTASCFTSCLDANELDEPTADRARVQAYYAGEFSCLASSPLQAQATTDCSATIAVSIPSTGKTLSRGGTISFDIGSVKVGESVLLQVIIRNTRDFASAAALKIKSVQFSYVVGHPEETEDQPSLACFHDAVASNKCSKALWKEVIPNGILPKAGQAYSESLFLWYKRFDAKERTAKVTLNLGGMANEQDRTFSFNVKAAVTQP